LDNINTNNVKDILFIFSFYNYFLDSFLRLLEQLFCMTMNYLTQVMSIFI